VVVGSRGYGVDMTAEYLTLMLSYFHQVEYSCSSVPSISIFCHCQSPIGVEMTAEYLTLMPSAFHRVEPLGSSVSSRPPHTHPTP
jgi:hypothetical protein